MRWWTPGAIVLAIVAGAALGAVILVLWFTNSQMHKDGKLHAVIGKGFKL